MNPEDFVSLGIRLTSGNSEAEFRSAVSRMYYGVFHLACNLLAENCGVMIPTNRAHAKVPQCLLNSSDPEVRSAGQALNTLREMRRIADYELENRNPSDVSWANEQILTTQTVLQPLLNLPAKSSFGETVESIRRYAKDVLMLNIRD